MISTAPPSAASRAAPLALSPAICMTMAETSGESAYPKSWKANMEPADATARASGTATSMRTPVAEGMMQPPKKRVTQMRLTTMANADPPGGTKHVARAAEAAMTAKIAQILSVRATPSFPL